MSDSGRYVRDCCLLTHILTSLNWCRSLDISTGLQQGFGIKQQDLLGPALQAGPYPNAFHLLHPRVGQLRPHADKAVYVSGGLPAENVVSFAHCSWTKTEKHLKTGNFHKLCQTLLHRGAGLQLSPQQPAYSHFIPFYCGDMNETYELDRSHYRWETILLSSS